MGVMDYLNNSPAWQTILHGFPDAAAIFQHAEEQALLGNSLDQNAFISQIQNTPWFKQTPAGVRTHLMTQVFDPASATRDSNDMARKILDSSQMLGLPMSLTQAADLAEKAITGAWDDNRINQEIVGATKYGPNLRLGAGTIGAAQTQIRGLAADYGVTIAPNTAYGWASKIADGLSTPQSFSEYAKNQAKVSHPYWQKQLDEGLTVRQLADPYIQAAAKTLELNPADIDLTDAKWQRPFQQRDSKGELMPPMNMADWQRTIMQDPGYGYDKTDGAKQAAFQMVDQLQTTFGAKK